jgi:hypothetical protein
MSTRSPPSAALEVRGAYMHAETLSRIESAQRGNTKPITNRIRDNTATKEERAFVADFFDREFRAERRLKTSAKRTLKMREMARRFRALRRGGKLYNEARDAVAKEFSVRSPRTVDAALKQHPKD